MKTAAVKLEDEYLEYLRQLSRERSLAERRSVTVSEVIRDALHKVYPMENRNDGRQVD